MRTITRTKVCTGAFLALAAMAWCFGASAQVATSRAPAQAPTARKAGQAKRSGPVSVESRPTAPQVVTILHRLNGLKMFRLLLRSTEEVGAIARLDDAFRITDEVHTNVIAGLAMEDSQTIAAWLPEAEAEMGPPPRPFAPLAPPSAIAPPAAPAPASQPTVGGILGIAAGMPGLSGVPGFAANLLDQPDVTIIARDGRRLIARYVGLDGVTGLSVLKLSNKSLIHSVDAKENAMVVGQHVRLLGPEPAAQTEPRAGRTIDVRMGETEGRVIELVHAPSGQGVARVRIKSARLSQANIGGIAINDAGETIGIVDAVEKDEATILPAALIRSATRRVLERKSSVPRPWLGIRGEPIGLLPFEQILQTGWQPEMARALAKKQRGIFLTSVAPGSPAAIAALRPGDVILRINEEEIKNAADFSWFLEEARPGSAVNFTVARPGKLALEAVEVKLKESPDPLFGLRMLEDLTPPSFELNPQPESLQNSLANSLISQGIETIALKPRVASRFGASGGLLVVYVQQATAASKAGLRSGDVIETINGQQLSSASEPINLFNATYTFNVVRNKERIDIIVVALPKSSPR
jgi:S1-C subfamily serine protease